MKYDPHVPNELKTIQEWFGKSICQRMSDSYQADRAQEYIVSTQTLHANERMRLYNESYWYRLIDALQEEFPTLVRLFGEGGFNDTFAIDYLEYYPPRHWSLNLLGDRFESWLKAYYTAEDKTLVVICAELDWTCQHLFLAKRCPPIRCQNVQSLLTADIALQPTIRLFCLPGHFMKWRKELLQHPAAHWESTPFPELLKDKSYYFILYRSPSLTVEWEEVCKEQYLLLDLISELGSIKTAADCLEERYDINFDRVETEIVDWIQAWLDRGWLRSRA